MSSRRLSHQERQILKERISEIRRERAKKAVLIDRALGIFQKDERIGEKALRASKE